nr:ACT domain-containing protein [Gammaproteobacteria bacterium]
DRPGVLAEVARILGERGISIEALMQKEPTPGVDHVPLIMLTHRVTEGHMNEAIARIEALEAIAGKVIRVRVERLNA